MVTSPAAGAAPGSVVSRSELIVTASTVTGGRSSTATVHVTLSPPDQLTYFNTSLVCNVREVTFSSQYYISNSQLFGNVTQDFYLSHCSRIAWDRLYTSLVTINGSTNVEQTIKWKNNRT